MYRYSDRIHSLWPLSVFTAGLNTRGEDGCNNYVCVLFFPERLSVSNTDHPFFPIQFNPNTTQLTYIYNKIYPTPIYTQHRGVAPIPRSSDGENTVRKSISGATLYSEYHAPPSLRSPADSVIDRGAQSARYFRL